MGEIAHQRHPWRPVGRQRRRLAVDLAGGRLRMVRYCFATIISSWTLCTPVTARAIWTACSLWSTVPTEPVSRTSPLRESTVISKDFTVASLRRAVVTAVVRAMSSALSLAFVGVPGRVRLFSTLVDAP